MQMHYLRLFGGSIRSDSNGTNLSVKNTRCGTNQHIFQHPKKAGEATVPSPSRGRLGWGWVLSPHLTHPHPNPPLEGGGEFAIITLKLVPLRSDSNGTTLSEKHPMQARINIRPLPKRRARYYSFPFKGKARMGMGYFAAFTPIPTPTLPLKGREQLAVTQLKVVP